MFVGKVVGQLWTSKHVNALEGMKLLLVLPLQRSAVGGKPVPREDLVVAADATVGAGIGEHVVVAYGRAARVCLGGNQDLPCEAAVAGIVDELKLEGVGPTDPPVPPSLFRGER
ncbi:MAG TPA: EutN/CcmL family microcompartment protein [Planctomycetota bacterium]|nr:EutN/CcmL family microcompartment protein [Planctomycetota bacterium]